MYHRLTIYIFFFTIVLQNLKCQSYYLDDTIVNSSEYSITIDYNGSLVRDNTTTFHTNYYITNVEPVKKIIIQNLSDSVLINPQILFNNEKNWYNVDNIIKDIFDSKKLLTDLDSLIAIYYFLTENATFNVMPVLDEQMHNIPTFFSCFGYGECSNFAKVFSTLCKYLNKKVRLFELNGHVIPEVNSNGKWYVFDPTLKTIYIKNDATFASHNDLIKDRYLITRTHHLGKAASKDIGFNFYIKNIYDPSDLIFSEDSVPNSEMIKPLSLNLKPGESLVYNYNCAKYIFQRYRYNESNIDKNIFNILANGQLIFNPLDRNNVNLSNLFYDYKNISISTKENLNYISLDNKREEGYFTILTDIPFPITYAGLSIIIDKVNINDSVIISYSKDNFNWNIFRNYNDSISFLNVIRQESSILNKYYLKFSFPVLDSINNARISKLILNSWFQLSKNVLPSFKIGKNIISYSDSNRSKNSVRILIDWEEFNYNQTPENNINCLYPRENEIVTNSKIIFEWTKPNDIDNDEIVNYEFILCNDDSIAIPISPNFNIYTSVINGNNASRFESNTGNENFK